jgi:transglutaminase-like putative cysteine protease
MDATIARPAVTDRRPSMLDAAAEVSLTLTTLAAVLCLGRLFVDREWYTPVVLAAIVAHALAVGVRRATRGPVVPVLASIIGAIVYAGWSLYPSSTILGIPGPRTLDAIGNDLSDAWSSFGRVVAPAPTRPGFTLACVIAAWAVAWFADTAAFRLRAPLEAVLPAVALLLFTAMLGSADHRLSSTVMLVAALLVFLLLHRVAGQLGGVSWVGDDVRGGVSRLVGAGAVIAFSAVVSGAVLGPALPGADDPPAIDWKGDRGGRGTRVTVSPLVDIRRRLVQQKEDVAFTVQADVPSYWRLTSLDRFDGRVWSSTGSYAKADDVLEASIDPAFHQKVTQKYRIKSLDAIWAPAAFQASGVEQSTTDLRWDDTSATLIVDTDVTDSNNIGYEVVSEVPQLTQEQVESASGAIPEEITETYLNTPPAFDRFEPEMRDAVGDAETPYQTAFNIQEWFRNNFTYNLEDVSEGHSESAVADFLSQREGYCEQFAGTFAAFARLAGIPARVAVGFTPGELIDRQAGIYQVRGKHAHAWPEVYLGGVGWVPFEPTPGRGIPGAESYTHRPQEQEGASAPAAVTPTASTAPQATRPTGPSTTNGALLPDELDTAGGAAEDGSGGGGSWLRAPVTALVVLLVLALVYVVLVRLAVFLHRSRRRSRARTPSRRVGLAWEEGAEAVSMLGPRPRAWETYAEFADRAADKAGTAAPDLHQLAGVATVAAWSADDTGMVEVEQAAHLTASIRSKVRARLDRRTRLRAELHPSLLIGLSPDRFANRR